MPSPMLEREHLCALRLLGRPPADLKTATLPRRAAHISVEDKLAVLRPCDGGEARIEGSIEEVLDRGDGQSVVTDIVAKQGDSGSPLLMDHTVIGVCQGMRPNGGSSTAVAVPFSDAARKELRRIALHGRRVACACSLLVVLMLFGAVAVRSWTTFALAGVDGPMNTIEDVETPNTITAHNAQLLTLRPTWRRTFPTAVRWWKAFPAEVGSSQDRVAIGTRIEEGIPGSLFLLDEMGRIQWSYTVPDGECVFSDETQTYDGFYVYRIFIGDLTGDGANEVLASFVHNDWYPCKVVIFSLDGEILGEYWHPGYLRTFAIGLVGERAEPMLIMTGSNNRFRPEDSPWNPQGLMAFSSTALQGQAPPYTGSGDHGNELWYYLLPNVDDEHKCKFDDIVIADSDGDGVTEILAHSSDGRFYYLNEDGNVLRVDLGDDYLKEFGYVDAPALTRVALQQPD